MTTLQFALVLTVAAIPVAMPTVLSVTMAVGARLLASKNAIVSRLVAIEELAGVDVLCSDKTGTLTQNKLTLGDPFAVSGITANEVILDAALASRADDDDTIDLAVLGGVKDHAVLDSYDVAHFEPFDPVGKRTEATIKAPDGTAFRVTKGAPQVILELSANAGEVKGSVEGAVNEFAQRGFRSLGVARADGDGPWLLIGVLPLFDPPREDAKGDARDRPRPRGQGQDGHRRRARDRAGNRQEARAGHQHPRRRRSRRLKTSRDRSGDGIDRGGQRVRAGLPGAQVPHRGRPAARRAHRRDDRRRRQRRPRAQEGRLRDRRLGPTDAARAAASIVLMTPGLSVIIDAIKESRRIVQRMNSYAIYRIAETLRVLGFVTLVILLFNFFPVTAIMIVLLALLNDGSILSIAYDNVQYKHEPEAWNMRLVLGIASVIGAVGPIAALGLFYLGDKVIDLSRPQLQTMMYLMLSVAGSMTIYLTRTRGPFWSIRPARKLLIAVTGAQIIATVISVAGIFVTALPWEYALLVWGYALLWFLLTDRVKLIAYQILDPVKHDTPPDLTPPLADGGARLAHDGGR